MDFLLINSSKNKNVTINNVTYYNPTQILEDSSPFLEIMPELNHLKNNMMSEIGSHINTLLNYCESNGIVVGIGSNPNRNNSFDLLSPYVEIDANEPAAEIGNTKESEIGKLHFLLHDLIHVSLGRPSITNVDLKNKKETKKRLIKILLQQEVLASVWSGYYYSRWYWNIREKLNPSAIFYNQGLTSPLNLKLDEVIQFYSLYMHGHFLKFFLFIKKHFNYEYFEKVKQHKIPLCFQPPKKLKLKFFDKIKDHLLLPMGASIFI